jgi:hypothetical protein
MLENRGKRVGKSMDRWRFYSLIREAFQVFVGSKHVISHNSAFSELGIRSSPSFIA